MRTTLRTRNKNISCNECIFSILGECSDCERKESVHDYMQMLTLNLKSSSVNLSMTFDENVYPKTPEEFIEQGWLHRVYRRLLKFTLKDVCCSAEDLTIDIFVNIIKPSKTMGTSYLERYDPKSRPFGLYLFTAVNNEVRRRGRRENTEAGKKVNAPYSFDTSPHMGEEFTPYTYYDEYVEDIHTDDSTGIVSAGAALDALIAEIKGNPHAKTDFKVLKLLLKGYTHAQAAEYTGMDRKEIAKAVKRIRRCKSIQSFRKTFKNISS